MARRRRTAIAPLLAAALGGGAQAAQIDLYSPFRLPPVTAAVTPAPPAGEWRRPLPARPVAPREAGDHHLTMRLKRQGRRPLGLATDLPGETPVPQIRSRLLTVADHFVPAAGLGIDLGWRGLAVRSADPNATSDGRDRLRARDWFLPFATLRYRPAAGVALTVAHQESMRAFGDFGLGLALPDYDALRRRLRPAKSRRTAWDLQWQDADRGTLLGVGAYRAAVRGRMRFANGMRLPEEGGAAALDGVGVMLRQRATATLAATLRYDRATVRPLHGVARRESELGMEALWTGQGWQGRVGLARSAAAAAIDPGPAARPWRVEAGLAYTARGPGGRPLRIDAALRDPGRMIGARLADGPTLLRAADRARALMLGARMAW
jgi:hypothetical protein